MVNIRLITKLELREGDQLKFGYSTRSYVLLNENSADFDDIPNEDYIVFKQTHYSNCFAGLFFLHQASKFTIKIPSVCRFLHIIESVFTIESAKGM